MKKRAFAWLVLALCLFASFALADGERIYDQAGLFTEEEKTALREEIKTFQEKTGMDFVLVTSSASHGDSEAQEIADAFYERGGFGLDEENSGVLYYIDMYERYHYLSTTGAAIDYMTDSRISEAISATTSYLSSGRYGKAAEKMIQLTQEYVRKGIPEDQYRYDVLTGERLTQRHKALTPGKIGISAAIGLIVCLVIVFSTRSRYHLKGSTYSYDYRENSEMKLTNTVDQYTNTTTTRIRKPDPPESRGGGSFGGGGSGSGVHTSSGGVSHGGGGGHF